jgi:hypothetical protein
VPERRVSWGWQPHRCDLLAPDHALDCESIGRGVLLLGDSLSLQMWAVLATALGAVATARRSVCAHVPDGTRRHCAEATVCDGAATVAAGKANYLWGSAMGSDNASEPWWVQREFLLSFDVVVFSTGAHGAAEFDAQTRVAAPAEALVRLTHPHTTLIYREAHPGAAQCSAHALDPPLPSLSAALEYQRAKPGRASWAWPRVLPNNALAAAALQPLRSRFRWLPVAAMSSMRWDAHRGRYFKPSANQTVEDCLHWCSPGPLHDWVRLLLHLLRVERTSPGVADFGVAVVPPAPSSRALL